MSKKFLITVFTLLIIGSLASVAIFFAKGYTISPKDKMIVGTGIITVASVPDSASVFVDDHLTTATNATISSLPPKIYTIKVVKEGFIPWEKKVEVKPGLVKELKITLFPAIPTTYPLTFNGVISPLLSPDGGALVFIVPTGKKSGVWVWTMVKNQPISFVRSSEPHQIATNVSIDYSKATLLWSPDSKQVLATVGNNNYLLETDRLNTEPKDITPVLESTLKSWEDDTKTKQMVRVSTIKDLKLRQIASQSGFIDWSPDETKFMARREPVLASESSGSAQISGIRVYDSEERKDYPLPGAKTYQWLPDSRHIVLVEDQKISLVDFDGTNKAVIYAGSFLNNFIFPWPDSSRLVFINSLPTPTASEPNLYGVNLK